MCDLGPAIRVCSNVGGSIMFLSPGGLFSIDRKDVSLGIAIYLEASQDLNTRR